MGGSESTLTSSQEDSLTSMCDSGKNLDDEITTVSERTEVGDPILEKLKSLKIPTLIQTSAPGQSSLTDIVVRKPSSSSTYGTVNPNVLLEHFSMYRDWQEKKANKIGKRQVGIGHHKYSIDASVRF